MKVAFDTSVLVAATLGDHPHHDRAAFWLDKDLEIERIASWHAMAETWATLTRIPLDPPISPGLAREVVERLEELIELVPPSARIYRAAIRRCADRRLRSGVLFDALHLITATERKADGLLTFNENDFSRLRTHGDPDILVPPDPPGLPSSH